MYCDDDNKLPNGLFPSRDGRWRNEKRREWLKKHHGDLMEATLPWKTYKYLNISTPAGFYAASRALTSFLFFRHCFGCAAAAEKSGTRVNLHATRWFASRKEERVRKKTHCHEPEGFAQNRWKTIGR